MVETERSWPETLMAAVKLQDGWCGEASLAFSPRQLLLACTLLAIGEVYGLDAEVFLGQPATVQVVVAGATPTRWGIEITKANDDDNPSRPEKWPDVLHDWAETCMKLSSENGEAK